MTHLTPDWFEAIRSAGATLLVMVILYLIVTFSPPRDPGALA